ncbi:MAG: hypothetical protein RL490_291 [Pseudomonadota bacterium]|jgi:hypothetical protein
MSSALSDEVSQRPCTASFRVTTAPDLGAALRVINLFAQQGLLPNRVTITTIPDGLVVSVRQLAIAAHRADLIAARMRTQVDVADVWLRKVPRSDLGM